MRLLDARAIMGHGMAFKEKVAAISGFILGALSMGFLLFSLLAISQNASGAEIGAYISAQTVLDDADAVQIGVTIEWERVEIDLSHGIKRVSWHVPIETSWEQDKWQSGSEFNIRAYPFDSWYDWRTMVMWSHLSDVTRGKPFNDKDEPSSDFVGFGVTKEWRNFELDIAYGWQLRECVLTKMSDCPDANISNNFMFKFRGYFWK